MKIEKNYITPRRKKIFLITFIIAIIVHFTCYSQLVQIADSYENGSYYISGEWEISIGRWGLVIIDILKFGLVSSAFSSFISFILLGIVAVLIDDLLEIKSIKLSILNCIILIVSPYVFNTLIYPYTSISYFIALLLSVFAVKLILSEKKINYLYSVIILIFTLSIYQVYISFAITLLVLIYLLNFAKQKINFKIFLKNIFKLICIILVSLFSYYLITKIILNILNIQFSNYYGLIDNFLYILKYEPNGILGAYNDWNRYYFYDEMFNNSPYLRGIVNFVIILLFIINNIIIINLSTKNFDDKFIKILTLSIVMLVLPILNNFIRLIIPTAAIAPTMSAPYIIITLIYISTLDYIKDNKKLKKLYILGIIIIIYLSYTYLIMGEATYISIQKNYTQIYSEFIRIIDRIETNENYANNIKIAIIGGKDYKNHLKIYDKAAISGRICFFHYYDEIPNYLYDEFGITNEFATEEEKEKISQTEEYKLMENFPSKNSIKVIDGILVVKLEEKIKLY